jgi:hypothetical protein
MQSLWRCRFRLFRRVDQHPIVQLRSVTQWPPLASCAAIRGHGGDHRSKTLNLICRALKQGLFKQIEIETGNLPETNPRSRSPFSPRLVPRFGGQPHIVAQWADAHNTVATAWVNADPTHSKYVEEWGKTHSKEVQQFIKENPAMPEPKAPDLAVVFFDSFSKENPGKFPSAVQHRTNDGKTETAIEPVKEGTDIQSSFFDMWRQEHADAELRDVHGDMVTTSGSGLDPNITLQNAEYQLDRVSSAWAKDTKRDQGQIRSEIEQILQADVSAPFWGLVGEKMVNVLEVNLELRKHFGAPPA